VLEHYTSSRRDVPDAHLLRRAALSAEFALAQYLVKGLATGDPDMIHEAESMLTVLADDVAEHGGQPISVEPLPQPIAAPGPASRPDPVTVLPAVSKVTLLAPDPAPGLAAVPSGNAMPAVQVTPIPPDAVEAPADGALTERGAPEAPATADGAAEAPTEDGAPEAERDTAEAPTEHDAPEAERDAAEAPTAADRAAEAPTATDDAAQAPATADDAPEAEGPGPSLVPATRNTSTQSTAVVQANSADDTSTAAITVVQAKFP